MSHATHPTLSAWSRLRSHRIGVVAALVALLALTAVVLALAIGGDASGTGSSAAAQQPAARSDGGPDESVVAASIGARASGGPDESSVAAAISRR
jgi:hypothetical protein